MRTSGMSLMLSSTAFTCLTPAANPPKTAFFFAPGSSVSIAPSPSFSPRDLPWFSSRFTSGPI